MYTIKQASIRSGVSVPLIRAWERRYGVIQPKRTASGYRLYDDAAISTLMRVRELTEGGWSASEASRAILAGEVPVTPLSAAPSLQEDLDASGHVALVSRFLEAATLMDIAETGAVLDELFARGSFESIVDDLLMPALASLGAAWAAGRLDVAAEHAASAAIHRRLSALYDAAAVLSDPVVVVGMPPGARHELGALAFAVALRRLGVGVLYLGVDVPVSSWVHVVVQNRPRVVVLAVVLESEQAATLAVAEAIRNVGMSLVVAVGGRSADWEAAREAGIVVLPERIAAAARAAAQLAGTPAAR
jgi:MerR family transcriptional regulator, light-induced transcriptional regulator